MPTAALITVGKSGTCQIAVVALAAELSEELRSMQVNARKVAFELLAEPVSYFRLEQPKTKFVIIFKCPWVVGSS